VCGGGELNTALYMLDVCANELNPQPTDFFSY
jgi:hypothetical protein